MLVGLHIIYLLAPYSNNELKRLSKTPKPVSYTHLDVYKRQVNRLKPIVNGLKVIVNRLKVIVNRLKPIVNGLKPVSYTHLRECCCWAAAATARESRAADGGSWKPLQSGIIPAPTYGTAGPRRTA